MNLNGSLDSFMTSFDNAHLHIARRLALIEACAEIVRYRGKKQYQNEAGAFFTYRRKEQTGGLGFTWLA